MHTNLLFAQSSRSKSVVSQAVLPNLNEILAPAKPAKPRVIEPAQQPPSSTSDPTTFFGDFDSDKDAGPSSLVQPDPPGAVEEKEKAKAAKQQAKPVDDLNRVKETTSSPPIVIEITPSTCYHLLPVYRYYYPAPSFYSYRPIFGYTNRRFRSSSFSYHYGCR